MKRKDRGWELTPTAQAGIVYLPDAKAILNEKDIETYLMFDPTIVSIHPSRSVVYKWIKRQYSLPSGILDLLGVTMENEFVVVEVKNVVIDPSALTQVMRYTYDLENILNLNNAETQHRVHPVVIGKGIDAKTAREAEALGISVLLFEVKMFLDVYAHNWDDSFHDYRGQQYASAATDKDFQEVLKEKQDLLDRLEDKNLADLLSDIEVDNEH